MRKGYYKCNILGQANFEALLESSVFGLREIVTKTKVNKIEGRLCGGGLSGDGTLVYPETIWAAAVEKQVRHNTLIATNIKKISREEMLEYLKSMSTEDTLKYTKTIENLKSMYNDELKIIVLEYIDRFVRKKEETKKINGELKRVRGISKEK